ncbi:MAG: ABC transporter permease [Anaerolineales bacterium]|nr:ABC transporter permease [Anaerolineales bacterium]
MRIRWRKVWLDLLGNRARTTLVVLAIGVGVFAVGFIATARTVLLRELLRNYDATYASSATLFTQPFDADLAESVAQMPEIAAAEARRTVTVQVQTGVDEWKGLVLTAVPDYNHIQLDRFTPYGGQWPPGNRQIVLEQSALAYINAQVGDALTIELDDGTHKELELVGLAYDSGLPSAEILERASGFVTLETIELLGMGAYYTDLHFRVAENIGNEGHIRDVLTQVEDKLARTGRDVFGFRIPPPGEHPVQDIIETLVLILGVCGVITLLLSGFLVVNTISALLTQQIRQIGVMKLVGARQQQIVGMYLVTVLFYGIVALLWGIPLAILAARPAVNFAAGMLNVEIASYAVPPSIILLQAAVGLLVPLLASLWPVISGVRITTNKALNNLGLGGGGGHGLVDRLFMQLQAWLPLQRPLIISLRNTIRQKGRLLLTLTTLILGTALFISVLSVRDSVTVTVGNFLRYHQYDVSLYLSRPYRAERTEELTQQMSGVTAVESWFLSTGRRVFADDTYSENFILVAAPNPSPFINPKTEAGRWLLPEDQQAVVINTEFAELQPDVAVGGELEMELNGRKSLWTVVGIVPVDNRGAAVYVNYDAYTRATRQLGMANTVKIGTISHEGNEQLEMATVLSDQYKALGILVNRTQTTEQRREATAFQFNIVVGFLVMMAVLLATVGGLGLTTTMSINILERIREIGVLRAIGASDTAVRQIVIAEGIAVGFLSWLLGSLLAIPISRLLSDQIGLALLGIPLDYTFSVGGMVFWLVAVIFIAIVASLGPARGASRLTIREVLAYE